MRILFYFSLFVLIVLSFSFVFNVQEYSTLISEDDLWCPYLYSFWEPVRAGRYLSSGINNLLIDIIPNIFSIHPNDAKTTYIATITAVASIIIIILLCAIAFIFTNNKENSSNNFINEKIIQFNKLPFSFLILYFLTFLVIFNSKGPFYKSLNLIYGEDGIVSFYHFYLDIIETTGFFEYIINIVFYVPFLFLLFKLIFNNEFSKKELCLLCICSILLCSSVEIINISIFIILTFILLLKKYFIHNEKKWKYFIILLYSSLASITNYYRCYFFRNGEFGLYNETENLFHNFQIFDLSIFDKCISFLINDFTKIFITPNKELIIIYIIFLILITLNKKTNKKFITLIYVISLSIIINYFLISFISYNFWKQTLLTEQYIITINLFICANFMLILGYFISTTFYKDSHKNIFIIIFCILTFLSYPKDLLIDYIKEIKIFKQEIKQYRIYSYLYEKMLFEQIEQNQIILPVFDNTLKITRFDFITYIYGDIFKTGTIINYKEIKDSHNEELFNTYNLTNEELKSLKFSKFYKNPNKPIYKPFTKYIIETKNTIKLEENE